MNLMNWNIKPGVTFQKSMSKTVFPSKFGIEETLLESLGDAFSVAMRNLTGKEYKPTITAAMDGQHSRNSLHYLGLAIDVRSNDMNGHEAAVAMMVAKQKQFNELYFVVEPNHIHIQVGQRNIILSSDRLAPRVYYKKP